nr:heavy metal-associated isoprenylated plant protein 7-like [Ipomoea trifida]
MHCEGCARKVRRCLKGVEDVVTDCKSHKVVVKGEKADPLKVVARVQKKSHRQPQVITVVLNVHMHCEACAQEIKRRIQRMKDPALAKQAEAGAAVVEVEDDPKLEMKKNELFYYYYPPQNYYPAPLSFAQEIDVNEVKGRMGNIMKTEQKW